MMFTGRRGGSRRFSLLPAAAALVLLAACRSGDRDDRFILAATHTLEDSGLLDSLAAQFRADHPEHQLSVVVAGSGEILAMGRRGDADALLTHSPDDEKTFVAEGHAAERTPVMHNFFIIAGPTADTARAAQAGSARDAFARIRDTAQPFVSRGDDSGTHRKELAIWTAAGGKPGATYIEAGTGMADALRVASQRRGYILSDLATFLMTKETLDLELLYQGDPVLRNDYSLLVISSARNPAAAQAFAAWITSGKVQKKIEQYGRSDFGRSLFIGDAGE